MNLCITLNAHVLLWVGLEPLCINIMMNFVGLVADLGFAMNRWVTRQAIFVIMSAVSGATHMLQMMMINIGHSLLVDICVVLASSNYLVVFGLSFTLILLCAFGKM